MFRGDVLDRCGLINIDIPSFDNFVECLYPNRNLIVSSVHVQYILCQCLKTKIIKIPIIDICLIARNTIPAVPGLFALWKVDIF